METDNSNSPNDAQNDQNFIDEMKSVVSNLNVNTLIKQMNGMSATLDRYRKYPDEIRFLMMFDKMHVMLDVGKMALLEYYKNEIKKINLSDDLNEKQKAEKINNILRIEGQIGTLIKVLNEELDDLDKFIQSETKSRLKSMEDKLDAFLLGPDYAPGNELMKDAKKDLETRASLQEKEKIKNK